MSHPRPPDAGAEEPYTSQHSEIAALQWLHDKIPGTHSACAAAEMERKGTTSTSLHYAEVNINFFALLVTWAVRTFRPDLQCGVFIDIGSGTGKCVVAASVALASELERCVGIEVMEDMHHIGLELLGSWEQTGRPMLLLPPVAPPSVELLCGDATDLAANCWTRSADVVFMNSLVFEPALMRAISAVCASKLPPCSFRSLLLRPRLRLISILLTPSLLTPSRSPAGACGSDQNRYLAVAGVRGAAAGLAGPHNAAAGLGPV